VTHVARISHVEFITCNVIWLRYEPCAVWSWWCGRGGTLLRIEEKVGVVYHSIKIYRTKKTTKDV